MALFKSGVIASASGSAGGYTYSHNKGGMYIRNRSIPTNPGSSYQQVIRGAIIDLTAKWQELLTGVQRAAWKVYADQVLLPNAFGDPRAVPALSHYIRSNVPRIQAGLPRVDAAPVIFNLGEVTPPSYASLTAPTSATFGFDNTDNWANEDDSAMLIYISPPRPQSVNYFKGPYRYADKIDGDAVTAPTSPAAITTPFAYSASATQRSFAQIRVTRADGRLSGPFRPSIDIP